MAAHLRSRRTLLASSLLLLALALPSCSNDNNPYSPGGGGSGGGGTTTLVGVAAGASVSGSLALILPAGTSPGPEAGPLSSRVAVNVTGTFAPRSAAAIPLGGTYDPSTKALSLSGGGYTFTGIYFSGVLRGNWVRAPSPATGTFVLVLPNPGSSPHAYCGTFTSTSGGQSGIIDLVIHGATVDGIAYTSSGTETRLQGTLGGGTSITLINPLNPGPYLATGTLNTSDNTANGTYDDGAGNSGTWVAEPC